MSLIEEFEAARRVSTGVIAVQTPDPRATIRTLGDRVDPAPIVQWDIQSGLVGLNKAGEQMLKTIYGSDADLRMKINLADVLHEAGATFAGVESTKTGLKDGGTLFFVMNAHRFLSLPGTEGIQITQGIWNLRDEFKQNCRTCVLLGPEFSLPAELAQDVLVLDEPYPDEAELTDLAERMFESAGFERPAPKLTKKIVAATRGLAAYPAEQAIVTNLRRSLPERVDVEGVWGKKKKVIDGTRGLTVYRGGLTYADIGGIEEAKRFFADLGQGEDAFELVVWIDEFEKAIAGGMSEHTGDSGVAKDQVQVILTEMEEAEYDGTMLVGFPGCSKSMLAKAIGGQLGLVTLRFDLGGMKTRELGGSEMLIRNAMKMIKSMSGGKALFVATCNKDIVITPEMKRRFPLVFFFDLFTKEDRQKVWPIYRQKYDLPAKWFGKDGLPIGVEDEGWTGAEIKNCARFAKRLHRPLTETQKLIVPVCRSAPELVRDLRGHAHAKYLSASYPGEYQDPAQRAQAAPAGKRRIAVE